MRREIFREYDIRGIAGEDLTPRNVEFLGRAIGTVVRRRDGSRITVGRDCRLSSDDYRDALLRGLHSSGIDTIDIGVVPTPLLYYSLFHYEADGGVMITGSHNPAEYNGFKICIGRDTIHGPQIRELHDLIERRDFEKGAGRSVSSDVIPSYMDHVRGQIRLSRKVRAAIDCGNGTAAVVAPQLLQALGVELVPLYCEIDGRFPNHHPDPTVEENLRDLKRAVLSKHAELGIAFDGDADRLGLVDERGRVIWGDMLMLIFAREILKKKPGSTFISEVKCSMNLYREIERLGGRAIMWKTGHSLIKAKMKEEKAALAGEMSGHMFFADRYYGFDDAIYAACRLVEILAAGSVPLSQMLADVPPTVVTPEIRVQCDDDKKFSVVDAVKNHYRKHRQVIDVDGARILFENGWGLVRASNTQDVLVLRFEAGSETDLEAIRSEVEERVAIAKAEQLR